MQLESRLCHCAVLCQTGCAGQHSCNNLWHYHLLLDCDGLPVRPWRPTLTMVSHVLSLKEARRGGAATCYIHTVTSCRNIQHREPFVSSATVVNAAFIEHGLTYRSTASDATANAKPFS